MEHAHALQILHALANGVDPASGEAFPPGSPYQRAETVRALFAAAQALERAARFARHRGAVAAKAGQPWSEEEDRRLLAAFDAGGTIAELAAAHERTQTGIRARLAKHGRIAA